jgi:hypothetical protein
MDDNANRSVSVSALDLGLVNPHRKLLPVVVLQLEHDATERGHDTGDVALVLRTSERRPVDAVVGHLLGEVVGDGTLERGALSLAAAHRSPPLG